MSFLKKIKNIFTKADIFVTLSLITLLVLSCIMVYSASMIGNQYGIFTNYKPVAENYFFKRQAIWAVLSFIAYIFFAVAVSYKFLKYKKVYELLFVPLIILLILPRLMGTSINGAYSWISIGGLTFQPSTIAQMYIIAYLAFIVDSRKEVLRKPTTIKEMTSLFIIPITILFFIFLQNDTGTFLLTSIVMAIMIFCSNISFKNLFNLMILSFVGIIFGGLFYTLLSSGTSYRVNRINAFLDPFGSNSEASNHIVNSMIAFGNGGLFGKGLGNSIQKLGYLPEAHTDFIIAVVAEELGYVGVLLVVFLLLVIIIKVMGAGLGSRSTFDSLLAIGFASLLLVQTIVNIGGVSGSIPMTGVPIPFFSSGGSSMLVFSVGLGIVMNLLSHTKYIRGGK